MKLAKLLFVFVCLAFLLITLACTGNQDGKAGLAPNYEKLSLKKLTAFAEEGVAEAQVALGLRYQTGRGVTLNDETAAKWFRAAAEQDHPEAQYLMGMILYNGLGLAQNREEAYEWTLKSANQKNIPGCNLLGIMLYRGDGTEKDVERAYFWIKVAETISVDEWKDTAAKGLSSVSADLSPEQIARLDDEVTVWLSN